MARRKKDLRKNRGDVAAWFGVSERTLGYWANDGCPCKGDGPYDLYQIAEWWAREIVAPRAVKELKREAREKATEDATVDVELKRERARQEIRTKELDYAERVGELLPRSHVRQVWQSVAQELRRAGELLQKQHGDDAQLLMLEALDAAEQVLTKHFDDSPS